MTQEWDSNTTNTSKKINWRRKKLRKNISFQPPEGPKVNINENLIIDTLHLTISTPMVGGGVVEGKVDLNQPVRVSSVRGNLRYWWRMMNQDRLNDEAKIWGSTKSQSKIIVEIEEFSPVHLLKHSESFGFKRYGTELYALFAAATNGDDIAQEGLKFTLRLTYPKDFQEDVRLAVSAWVYFGGIGARTRRGCGTLECAEKEKLFSVNEVLKSASNITLWRKQKKSSAMSSWRESLELYRKYRQARNLGNGTKPGRSKWPEPDSIRQITGDSDPRHSTPITSPLPSFPRAALGLPIIFQFVGRGEPKDVKIKPKISNRMSSPVITKALYDNGAWYSAVIILPHEHVFNAELETDIKNKTVNIPELRGERYQTVEPMRGQNDAIAGFEAFISKNDFKKEEIKS